MKNFGPLLLILSFVGEAEIIKDPVTFRTIRSRQELPKLTVPWEKQKRDAVGKDPLP